MLPPDDHGPPSKQYRGMMATATGGGGYQHRPSSGSGSHGSELGAYQRGGNDRGWDQDHRASGGNGGGAPRFGSFRGSDDGGGGNHANAGNSMPASLAEAPVLSPMTDDEGEGGALGDEKINNGVAAAAAATGNGTTPTAPAQRSESPDDDFPIHIALPPTNKSSVINPIALPGSATTAGSGGVPRSVSSAGGLHDESWETPDTRFEEFVADVVRRRIGKYEQPDHPTQLSRDEASSLFRAIRREIVAKEVNAFEERQRTNQSKPIERQKLENRIKDYVRDRVRKYHAGRAGGQ